jgi:hypothetical protein
MHFKAVSLFAEHCTSVIIREQASATSRGTIHYMSEHYEAIIVVSSVEVLRHSLMQAKIDIPLVITKLALPALVLYLSNPRAIIDDALMPHIAREISIHIGRALAVLYDNQIDWRSAYYYENGTFIKEYTEDDELWVILQEDGTAQHEGQPLRIHELAADQEYDCLVSAIDAGLHALGVGDRVSSEHIKQAVCYAPRS